MKREHKRIFVEQVCADELKRFYSSPDYDWVEGKSVSLMFIPEILKEWRQNCRGGLKLKKEEV